MKANILKSLGLKNMNKQEWLNTVLRWKNKWTQFPPEIEDDSNGISLYKFVQVLNNHLKDDSVIIADAGSCGYVLSQSLQLKDNQRYLLDSGQMAMGACLGMSIGASFAKNKGEIICIVGDGSFQTCLRELSVIRYHFLPIKIFVWCNNGYLSIRNTSKSFYEGRLFGTDKDNGIFFPDLEKIASCYDMFYNRVDRIVDLDYIIKKSLKSNYPTVVEVICDPNQKITPNLAMKDGKPCELSDLAPFLSEEEYNMEMIKDE